MGGRGKGQKERKETAESQGDLKGGREVRGKKTRNKEANFKS